KALLSNFSFERLPGTRLEGQDIAEILSVQPLLGDSVLESRLKSHKSPRILHIATHGFFLKDIEGSMVKAKYDPTLSALPTGNSLFCILSSSGIDDLLHRSGLALAGANTWSKGEPLPDEAEDGILTAADVSGLDLVDTELVVLSACETGLGNIKQGEGVFGLQRAFTLAGANTVVMSLWNVPDKETRELMVDFYGRITNGQPRAEALRQAQMAMKKKYPDPLYWGAFICLGDPSPLPHYETVN
ncbi:MAG: CHAT domain-containing protein, partial [Gammaproteobacteria bacterium]|nr:CHAT domain-containing protein [Gammaproteobacteria bacterium]